MLQNEKPHPLALREEWGTRIDFFIPHSSQQKAEWATFDLFSKFENIEILKFEDSETRKS